MGGPAVRIRLPPAASLSHRCLPWLQAQERLWTCWGVEPDDDIFRAMSLGERGLNRAERLKTDQGNIARLECGRTQATIRTPQPVYRAATGHSLSFRPLPKNGK